MIDVIVISGSESDRDYTRSTELKLVELKVTYVSDVISAHRESEKLREYVQTRDAEGAKIYICLAGMAAALPGVVAGLTGNVVIGVPLPGELMGGLDSLLSIVQMPKGVPVATMSMGHHGAINAAILAHKILNT